MLIREINEKDIEPLYELLNACANFKDFEIEVAVELVRDKLNGSPYYHIQVAVDENGRLLGYLCYGEDSVTVGTYNLYWIAVHPDTQGRGVGKALIEHLEKRIKEMNGRMVVIETSSTDRYKSAQNFYIKMGYILSANIANYYAPNDGKLIYTKEL